MRKQHWLVGLLALTALVLGLGSATVMAQESEGEPTRLGLFARMANILGLEEEQVQEAYEQARQEMRDERFEEMVGQRLDSLVESGRITQEQADELRDWYASRPDSFWLASGLNRGKEAGRHKGRTFDGRGYSSHMAQMKSMKSRMDRSFGLHLSGLVEKGLISQEQADEIRSTYAAKAKDFAFSQRVDRGKGCARHWGGLSRGQGHFFQGSFALKSNCPHKGESGPATTTPSTPAATPTTPADSSDSN